MAFDRQAHKTQEAGLLNTYASGGTVVSDAVAMIGQVHSDFFIFQKTAADATAADTVAETYTGIYLPFDCIVRQVRISPISGALTANATNYATLTVSSRNSAGTGLATVATYSSTTSSLSQGVALAATLTTANVALTAGSTITWQQAKAGTGVVVPSFQITLVVEWN